MSGKENHSISQVEPLNIAGSIIPWLRQPGETVFGAPGGLSVGTNSTITDVNSSFVQWNMRVGRGIVPLVTFGGIIVARFRHCNMM